MDRAQRRALTDKKHNQRKKYYHFCGTSAFVMLETPKRVSTCRCCSNPRKTWKGKDKLTLQERKQQQDE
jgi:hypothetical protein